MTKKELVVLASRAIALYLIFWALDNLSYVPVDAFALSHYSALPQEYLYKYHLVLLLHHLVASILFFVGAVWVYRCGPSVENFCHLLRVDESGEVDGRWASPSQYAVVR